MSDFRLLSTPTVITSQGLLAMVVILAGCCSARVTDPGAELRHGLRRMARDLTPSDVRARLGEPDRTWDVYYHHVEVPEFVRDEEDDLFTNMTNGQWAGYAWLYSLQDARASDRPLQSEHKQVLVVFGPNHKVYRWQSEGMDDELLRDRVVSDFDEPLLSAERDRGDASMTVRLTYLPTFHAPVCLRAELKGDTSGVLLTKVLDGKGGYVWGDHADSRRRELTADEVRHVRGLFQQLGFQTMRSHPLLGGFDGSTWLLEVADAQGYHMASRHSPVGRSGAPWSESFTETVRTMNLDPGITEADYARTCEAMANLGTYLFELSGLLREPGFAIY